jgi:flagellar basal-body rod modification protein FlgD
MTTPVNGLGQNIVGTLPATATATTATAASSTTADSSGQVDFLKLLVAQLKYQNPNSPTDGAQYLAQMAQFTQVQKLTEIDKAQAEALTWNKTVSAQSMLGASVTGTTATGATLTDTVVGVTLGTAGPTLKLSSGASMDIGSVTSVMAQPAATRTA